MTTSSRPKFYHIEICEPWFTLIKLGLKKIEGKENAEEWSCIKEKDIILVLNSDHDGFFQVRVTKIVDYNSTKQWKSGKIFTDPLLAFLQNEGLENTLPGVTSLEEGKRIYHQWSNVNEIKIYGFRAFYLEVLLPPHSLERTLPLLLKYEGKSSTEETNFHLMEVSEPWFSLIRAGLKKIEGRKNSKKWSCIKNGDIIKMINKDSYFPVRVIKIVDYNSVKQLVSSKIYTDPLLSYLNREGLENTLPGIVSIEEAQRIYLQWSTPEEIMEHGFKAIHIEVIPN